MTVKDQIIEEIRQPRREISAECGHDLHVFGDYMEKQNALFAPQVAAWKQIEEERLRALPIQPWEADTPVVAEEPHAPKNDGAKNPEP